MPCPQFDGYIIRWDKTHHRSAWPKMRLRGKVFECVCAFTEHNRRKAMNSAENEFLRWWGSMKTPPPLVFEFTPQLFLFRHLVVTCKCSPWSERRVVLWRYFRCPCWINVLRHCLVDQASGDVLARRRSRISIASRSVAGVIYIHLPTKPLLHPRKTLQRACISLERLILPTYEREIRIYN